MKEMPKFPNPTALSVFLAVIEEGGVGNAALSLGVTQPAVSQHLRALEAHVGQPLFEKQGRKLALTQIGSALLPEARRAVQALASFHRTAEALDRMEQGWLEAGASSTAATYVLPRFLMEYQQLYPNIKINVSSGSSEHVIKRLLAGQLEFAIVEGVEHFEGYHRKLFYEDELVLIVPPDHPWAAYEEVPPEWLVKIPLIMRQPGSVTWRVVERMFEQLGLELNPVMYTDNNEVTKRLVLEGAGVGIVSNVVVRINVRVGNLKVVRVKLDEGELRRIFWLVYPKQVSNPAAAALIDQLLA